jgi:hypothetical protein
LFVSESYGEKIMAKSSIEKWIKAFRKMSEDGTPITSLAVVEAMKISDTERSSALDIAAGWISTMRRYGLIRAVRGQKVSGPRRQLQVYELTNWGHRYKAKGKATGGLRIAANPPGKQG